MKKQYECASIDYIYINIYTDIYIYIYIYKTQYLPISFARRLLQGRRIYRFISISICVFHINYVFKKFFCGCGYVSTVNEIVMYTKL